MRIAHIVNPVKVPPDSDLFDAQPITFSSMKIAADSAAFAGVDVQLFTAQFPEDHPIIPPYFKKTSDLSRSILDFAELSNPKKLPLIDDILQRLYMAAKDVEYLIYTNVDIGLMPFFYEVVSEMMSVSLDACVINRRTIYPKKKASLGELKAIYALAGVAHPGYDCFIFKRALYPQMKLNRVVIGANFVGKAMVANLAVLSNRFSVLDDQHLTFHIGDDRIWKNKQLNEFERHNSMEVRKVLLELDSDYGLGSRNKIPGRFLVDTEPNPFKKILLRSIARLSKHEER